MLGSLGVPELLFIFGLALLVFGPKRMPEIGRALGRGMSELRKASTELKRTLNAEIIEQEMRDADPRRVVRDSLRDVKQSLTDAVDINDAASSPSDTPARTEEPARVEGSIARSPGGGLYASEPDAPAAESSGAQDPAAPSDGASDSTASKDGGGQ
ncbi:MAG: twin-arginine translocase TatA/TatE family subunit [Acidobacteriota bacterium]